MQTGDTIAAISSAVGLAARIIVRLSGPDACAITHRLASSLPGAAAAERVQLSFAKLNCPAWVYSFRGPRSYTGEDLVEFHIPGNSVLAGLLLDELLKAGARAAEPGEFTARAYFNGRIDLTEAEGVAATIAAGNEQELAAARKLMAGELARRLAPVVDQIAQTLALLEVGIDFSDEQVTTISPSDLAARLAGAGGALDQLLRESVRFERLAHEPRVVLVGRPNAGKSTLLNRLAERERAVISPIAGTTRDVLSIELPLQRGVVRLLDVAGIDCTDDAGNWTRPFFEKRDGSDSLVVERQRIEEMMREHALRAVESADVVLLVVDAADTRPRLRLPREVDWVVLSKTDLLSTTPPVGSQETAVSAASGAGLDDLRAVIDRLSFGDSSLGSSVALNTRHVHAIEEASAALARAKAARDEGAELVALELRDALDALGSISGRVTPDDLLGRIFGAFCIGK